MSIVIEHLNYIYMSGGPYETHALTDVNLTIGDGEFIGLAGHTGSGKSTLAKALCGFQPIASGTAAFAPMPRGAVQMIFQDAVGSLNPRKTIGDALTEVLTVHNLCPKSERPTRVATLLDEVGLPADVSEAYPRELSGGQCQRISIARALAMNPRVLIADEPVSALDVSVQARVLNLLADLRARRNLTILLISHDLAVVRTVCDRLIVMHDGEIVERGDAKTVFSAPSHPYTQTLLAAVPDVAAALES